MISIYDQPALEAALRRDLDPELRHLISIRLASEQHDLLELTHIIVVEAGDALRTIEDELGFSPLNNPIDSARFGTKAFVPYWDYLKHHTTFWELIVAVGDGGFAFIVIIQDAEGTPSELLAMCRRYADDDSQ